VYHVYFILLTIFGHDHYALYHTHATNSDQVELTITIILSYDLNFVLHFEVEFVRRQFVVIFIRNVQ